MYIAPVCDEEERRNLSQDYSSAMSDWNEFVESTITTYGVDMSILQTDYDREQREYYLLSSRWSEHPPESVLADPVNVKSFDMISCTIDDSRGISSSSSSNNNTFTFDMSGDEVLGPVSGLAGWFTADFKSRTDEIGLKYAPKLANPALLCTAPESGYTHWGQQTFYFFSGIPLIQGEITRITGSIEMNRSKDNARLYDCRIKYSTSRSKKDSSSGNSKSETGLLLRTGRTIENIYQIP